MLSEITTALASLKAASDIIKGFNSLQLEVAVKEKSTELFNIIISLQSNILAMQSDYSELLTSKSNIEKELLELKNSISDKSKYILVDIAPGVLAYTLRETINSLEPKHYLCQNCFDTKNQKSVLQRKYAEHKDLICNSCKSTYRISDDNNRTQQITFGV
jgi:uncharacterized protein YbaR (Trm112 family)